MNQFVRLSRPVFFCKPDSLGLYSLVALKQNKTKQKNPRERHRKKLFKLEVCVHLCVCMCVCMHLYVCLCVSVCLCVKWVTVFFLPQVPESLKATGLGAYLSKGQVFFQGPLVDYQWAHKTKENKQYIFFKCSFYFNILGNKCRITNKTLHCFYTKTSTNVLNIKKIHGVPVMAQWSLLGTIRLRV